MLRCGIYQKYWFIIRGAIFYCFVLCVNVLINTSDLLVDMFRPLHVILLLGIMKHYWDVLLLMVLTLHSSWCVFVLHCFCFFDLCSFFFRIFEFLVMVQLLFRFWLLFTDDIYVCSVCGIHPYVLFCDVQCVHLACCCGVRMFFLKYAFCMVRIGGCGGGGGFVLHAICVFVNLLNPTGYVTHQQFNIQQLYVLRTLYLCVLYLSENKQRLVPLTA